MKILKYLYFFLFFTTSTIFSASREFDVLYSKLWQTYYDIYEKNKLCTDIKMMSEYSNIQNFSSVEEKLVLTAIWGTVSAEVAAHLQKIDPVSGTNFAQFVREKYWIHAKQIKKSKSIDVLTESAFFSFAMLKVFQKYNKSYFMNARTYLLQALKSDPNNLFTQLGLGMWLAELIMQEQNRNVNLAHSQMKKYLSDENLSRLNNDRLLYQALAFRTMVCVKLLNIESAKEDYDRMKKIYPNYINQFMKDRAYKYGIALSTIQL